MKTNDELTSLRKLPPLCYTTLEADLCQVVAIKLGVAGYCPVRLCGGATEARHMAARLNAALAVPPTPQQAIAMLIGSRFGWEMPGADPDSYQQGRGMTPANHPPSVR